MGLGSVITNAVLGNGGTTLETFLTKFSSSAGVFVDTIDPLHTFDVSLKFYPSSKDAQEEKSLGKEMLDALKKAGSQALDNVTMGFASAIGAGEGDIISKHGSFTPKEDSFVAGYLAQPMKLASNDDSNSPMILQLGPYVQNMSLPTIKTNANGEIETLFGKFPLNGNAVVPESNTFTMTVLNTKLPLMEFLFYPWMKEVTLPYWSYENAPYTTAEVIVDFSKHADIQYHFHGSRPTAINTYEPTQEPDTTITRDVTLTFDFMTVQTSSEDLSKHKVQDNWKDKLLGIGKDLANAAGGMLNA